MEQIPMRTQFEDAEYSTGIFLPVKKQALIADILDLITSNDASLSISEVFEILDETKGFILRSKTLRDAND